MNLKEKNKQEHCRFCHRFMGKNHDETHCVVDGWQNNMVRIISASDCEICEQFESKYIEYPLTINGIENSRINITGSGQECGTICEITPCGKEYEGKSFIGIYLGDLPVAIHTSFCRQDGILKNTTFNNPAIFVPELKKIIFGCESWWREINSFEDFKVITKKEIENTWYMQVLKMLQFPNT